MKKNRLIRFPGLLKRFRKNLMFIKCCIVFIFVFSLNLSAHVFSQSKLVTLDLKEVSVEKFVDAVKQQTGMKMMYNSGVVREAGQVSVQVKDKELSEVLDMVLKKVNLEYELYNDIILIRAKGEVPAGPKVLKGVVKDKSGAVLPGVTVVIKGTTLGVSTDIDGKYSITIPEDGKETVLMFTFVGMKPQEVRYAGQETLNVILTEEVAEMEEVVVNGYFTRKKESFTGVSKTFSGDELKTISTGNILNTLSVLDPSFTKVVNNEMGSDPNTIPDFEIRGSSSLKAEYENNPNMPTFIMDGFEVTAQKVFDLDPNRVRYITILKDASATAVYGTRGANGVVVVTTKRGKAGKLHVNFKTNATYSYSPRMPEYTDAYQYATLANEARSVRGDDPVYSATELELFKTGLDPDLYPNVNWRDVILKDHVINNQHHLSISGGGQSARYYMSLGILNSEALFKQDKSASKHDVNVNYHKYNFRTNIDADLTKTTMLSLNLEAVIKTQNAPGTGSSNKYLWESQANLPPTVVPVRYSNGQLPAYGTNLEDKSPYVRLNYMGYTTNETYSTKINVGLSQDLGMITEGLSVRGLFSFSMNGAHIVDRHMNPEQYYADPKDGRYLDGSLKTVRTVNKEDMTATQGSASNRELYFEAAANYKRLFNQDHRVTGLAHFYRQELTNVDWGNGVLVSIPKRYQALSFRGTYSYKDTYFVEGNLGYTGSENFNKERRYGWFPSISGGWVPTQYDWYRNLLPFNNFLKFRASWGRVGNDRLKEGNVDIRFPYLTTLGSVYSTWGNAIAENRTGSMNLKWEVSTKTNFGIDARFFDDKIDMTVDFFHTKTTDIFQKRANIPDESGLSNVLPYANIGSMKSWGMDGTLAYTHTFNKDMSLTVRGNFTHAENEVIYWEQSGVNYPYQSYSGVPYGVQRGLIALGLFKDEDDIKSSPKQTFMDNYRPGDIKYKDVNGDGKIDTDDVVPLNYSNVPFIQYGFALDWNYKAFRVSILFEGVSKVQYFQGGLGFYPFYKESRGNLLTMVANPANRWIPREYAEANGIDLALAENPNAKFPRLTYGDNANNNRQSTFWLADGKYLRLKNVDVSYRFTNNWLKSRVGVESATLSLIGENLHVWDKVKLFDPSQASGNGAEYPLQRMYTLQLNLTF